MKKKGNVCDYTQERNSELLGRFRRMVREAPIIDLDVIFRNLSRSKASRFFVSESRAYMIIKRYLKHGEWDVKSALRREMFEEIYRRATDLIREGECDDLEDAVYMAVNSEAPKFYLTPRSVRTLLYEIING